MSTLDHILHYFPATTLPLLLSDDHISEFEAAADQLPQSFVEEYIMRWENDTDDETTEYIPCAALPPTDVFYPIVYWKAGLLRYDFVLATFDKNGSLISRKSIASTVIDGNMIKKSIASIEPDYIINIIAGHSIGDDIFDPTSSKAFSMEILPSGEIIFTLDTVG
jgi:hypothetical protein